MQKKCCCKGETSTVPCYIYKGVTGKVVKNRIKVIIINLISQRFELRSFIVFLLALSVTPRF